MPYLNRLSLSALLRLYALGFAMLVVVLLCYWYWLTKEGRRQTQKEVEYLSERINAWKYKTGRLPATLEETGLPVTYMGGYQGWAHILYYRPLPDSLNFEFYYSMSFDDVTVYSSKTKSWRNSY